MAGAVFKANPDRLEANGGKIIPAMVKAIQEPPKMRALEARLGG